MEKFRLTRDGAVLVIIDVQERLAAVMERRAQVVSNCLHLLEAARLMDVPVVVTEQYPKGLGFTVAELRDAVPSYRPVEKLTFSSCDEPAFMAAVEGSGRKTVLLAGMEAHICVLQTCLGLLDRGYYVHLVRDAVCSRAEENALTGVEFMRDAGAVITSTEAALFQLLGRAGTEEFRAISKRVK
jgi:nicotinamidase-related amidase